MSTIHRGKKYVKYKWKAINEHALHSPFVFNLYTEVIKNKGRYCAYDELQKIRLKLLKDQSSVTVTDLGAGSNKMGTRRKISSIAKYSCIGKKYGELLFRICGHFKPNTVLELGTSLGLSSLYMASASPGAEITTFEGCPQTFSFAQKLISGAGFKNIQCINSSFDAALAKLPSKKQFDLIYIDGNHTKEATLRYFKLLLKHVNNHSLVIFDDIHWSEGMSEAWEEIKEHASITLSLDLYKFGLVWFRTENKEKQEFCLRF